MAEKKYSGVRESKPGRVNDLGDNSKTIEEDFKKGCLKRADRSFAQGLQCQQINSMAALMSLEDAVFVSHSPQGCVGCTIMAVDMYRVGQAHRGIKNIKNPRIIVTNLDQKSVVFGGEQKLKQSVKKAVERYNPKLIFIYASCASGIIGDDIDAIAGELQEEYEDAIIVPIHCEGFKSKICASGFDAAFLSINKYILKGEKQPKEKGLVNKNDLFQLESNNIYNVKYYNEEKKIICKFEVFKILIYQIMKIIKELYEYKYEKEKENKLSLERTPSNVSVNDCDRIFEKIISFFFYISPQCELYDDIILYFYKLFINSGILIKIIIKSYSNVVMKILRLSFESNNNINNNIKLIMLKLLCQIIENINEDNLEDFSDIIQNFENKNTILSNPLLYLCEKLINVINDNNNKQIEKIIIKYYIDLLFICRDKILELKKDDKDFWCLFNNKMIFNLLLLDFDFCVSENKFIINPISLDTVQKNSFFNKNLILSIKTGIIICFVEEKFKNYTKSENRDDEMHLLNIFNKSSFLHNSSNDKNKYNYVLVMNYYEQQDFYDITNIEILDITDLEFIKTESKYKEIIIEKNIKNIFNIIKEELNKNELNEKGKYLILKLLQKIIHNMKKEDL